MATKEITVQKPSVMRPFYDFPRMEFPRIFDWFEDLIPASLIRDNGQAHMIKIEEVVKDNEIIIRAEMPGVDPDKDIDVSLGEGFLTIKGEKREEYKDADRSEFHYGSFARSIALPSEVKDSDVHATYKDGILEVKVAVPKTAVKTKKVAVNRAK